MQAKPIRDFAILGDFLRFTLFLYVPFFLLGAIHGWLHKSFLMAVIVNPVVYSIGISLIIVVLKHDLDDLLALVGLAKQSQLGLNLKYARDIQEISCLMAVSDFEQAMRLVKNLLHQEPNFVNALSLKGQILLEGFQEAAQARECFEKVLTLTKPDDEQHRLADSLIAACYDSEE